MTAPTKYDVTTNPLISGFPRLLSFCEDIGKSRIQSLFASVSQGLWEAHLIEHALQQGGAIVVRRRPTTDTELLDALKDHSGKRYILHITIIEPLLTTVKPIGILMNAVGPTAVVIPKGGASIIFEARIIITFEVHYENMNLKQEVRDQIRKLRDASAAHYVTQGGNSGSDYNFTCWYVTEPGRAEVARFNLSLVAINETLVWWSYAAKKLGPSLRALMNALSARASGSPNWRLLAGDDREALPLPHGAYKAWSFESRTAFKARKNAEVVKAAEEAVLRATAAKRKKATADKLMQQVAAESLSAEQNAKAGLPASADDQPLEDHQLELHNDSQFAMSSKSEVKRNGHDEEVANEHPAQSVDEIKGSQMGQGEPGEECSSPDE